MASLAVSVGIHLALAAVLLFIVPTGAARMATRLPVRITYFEQPLRLTEPTSALELTLPEVNADPSTLPGRPLTAGSLPPGAYTGPGILPEQAPGGGAGTGSGAPGGAGQAPEAVEVEETPAPPTPAPIAIEPPKARAPVAVVAPPQQVASLPEPKAAPTPRPPAPTQAPQAPKAKEAVAVVTRTFAPGEIVEVTSDMPRPTIVHRVVPDYPPVARSQRVRGIVQVEVVVDSRGQVTDAKVVASPSPLLNKEALEAAREMRFAPYEIDGQIVSIRTRIPFKFELQH